MTAREARDSHDREREGQNDIVQLGDCLAPGAIAACDRDEYEYAQEMDAEGERGVPFRRENPIR